MLNVTHCLGVMQSIRPVRQCPMIQKSILSNSQKNSLDEINWFIDSEMFLKMSVVDVQVYDDLLVVMTDHAIPRTFVRLLLKRIWKGPIDVFCATALMGGNEISLT